MTRSLWFPLVDFVVLASAVVLSPAAAEQVPICHNKVCDIIGGSALCVWDDQHRNTRCTIPAGDRCYWEDCT